MCGFIKNLSLMNHEQTYIRDQDITYIKQMKTAT